MHRFAVRHRKALWIALTLALGSPSVVHATEPAPAAQSAQAQDNSATSSDAQTEKVRKSTTLSTVNVNAQTLAGGLMATQDQPKQVSTISAQAIAEVPITADYTQIINSTPGVNSASYDGFGLTDSSSYTIRGFNASEIGVTLDGVPVNDAGDYIPYASEYGEARNYESITVSPGSADLDMPDLGAVGGHISFITKTPTQNFNIFAGQTFGSNDARSTYIRINTGDTGPVRSWISISDDSDDKWRGAGQDRIHRIQAKSVWTIDGNNSVTANFNYNHEENYFYMPLTKAQATQYGYYYDYGTTWAPTPAGGFLASQLYNDPAFFTQDSYYRLYQNPFKSWVTSLDGEFKLSENLSLSVIPYFQFGDGNGSFAGFLPLQSGANGQPIVQANQYADGQYAVLEAYRPITYRPGINAKFTLNLGLTDTLDWGLWYERSRQLEYIDAQYVDPNTGVPQAIWGDNHLLTYSNGLPWENYSEYDLTTVKKVFVEDSWTPTDAWTLNAGVAYLYTERVNQFVLYPNNPDPVDWTSSQNSDQRYHNFLPTLGVSWRPNENNQIYYSITRTFRAPQDSSTYGNARLGLPPPLPESAWSNEVGWRFTDGPLTLHTDAYLANMGNRTAVGLDQDTFINYYINAGPVRMAGFNTEGNLDLGHGLSLYSSYTYTQSKVKQNLYLPATEDTAAEFYNTQGKQFPGTPRNMSYLGARYSQDGLTLNLNGKFTGSEYGDFLNTERVPSNFTLNGSASYELPDYGVLHKTTIAINALNLLNRHYLALPASPTLSAEESSPTYYVGAPRQWYLTISTTFL
ncbi:TonB-dependent receptor family protein [Dyella sp.]|jgi:iron complex outermembrane receptor protein|uniref:TonB-dependent receptor family protein n=1 Tax=Dyella sp. TaxID=1869338 RepID=UPI002C0161A1|nr:TonB-dependent receptor [Dyella sp.]HTC28330.1 TonB-dependent receptor [Dyella sp.]